MEILVDAKTAKLKFDKTVEATISNADKAQSGEYRVEYFGDTFTAYSENPDIIYKVGNRVLVKIPENNFDNKKWITQKLSYGETTVNETLESTQSINKIDLVGVSWDNIYNYELNTCLAVEGETNNSVLYYNNEVNSKEDLLFQQYAKDRNSFLLKGTFQTLFTEIPQQGNYGLKVTFKYKTPTDPEDLKYRTLVYYIDHYTMLGNSYKYNTPSEQYLLLSVEGKYLLGIEKIELFQEGMVLKNGGRICVSDILLQFVEPIEDNAIYSLNILTKEGIYLNNTNHTKLSLQAQYKYLGVNILSESSLNNYEIYWFKEDKKVGRFSEDYLAEGGIGWKLVDKNQLSIEISNSDVLVSSRYKLVVKYNDYTLEKIITIYQENSDYSLSIDFLQDKEDLSIGTLKVTALPENSTYEYYWMKESVDGFIEEIKDTTDTIKFDLTDIYLNTTYYCSVYMGEYLIGTISKLISTDVQENDLEITFVGGNTTFLYDEAGDITLATAETKRELSFNLSWKNDKASQYSVEWTVPNADETMLTDFLFNEDKTILYYKLRPKYSAERTNNTVSLLVKLNDGREFEVKKEFVFLKQGNPGTNGTTFTTKIVADKDCLIFGDTPVTEMRLTVQAYKDGELATSLGYAVTTSWSIPSLYKKFAQIVVNSTTGQINTNEFFGNYDYYSNIVKATTTITKGNESIKIYNYYPVKILRYGNTNYRDLRVISQVKEVLYGSDGYNPNYASTTPFKTNMEGIEWEVLGNKKATLNTSEEGTFLTMPKMYLSSDGALAVAAKNGNDNWIICPIVVTLNTYGLDWVNSWDGLTVDVNEKEGSILAPMIGAGEKDSDNTFTGVVMGVHSLANEGSFNGTRNGLIGYLKGQASFGFLSDGTGFIGLSDKGRIIFDGDGGTITSGNYYGADGKKANQGMQIDLKEGIIDSFNFKLTTGTININSIANANKTNNAISISDVFKVTHAGKLTCTNADVKGTIRADEGYIADFTFDEDGLSGGSIFGSYINGAEIEAGSIYGASIEAGSISGTNITGGTISGTSITGKTTINIGGLSIDANGNMSAQGIDIGLYDDSGAGIRIGNGNVYCYTDDGNFNMQNGTFYINGDLFVNGDSNIIAKFA
ncbi:MAG: hypothetical protein IKT40_06070 [Bacilli bacterium]|nr:hypothetical protein [Bacilli bacterium]